MTASLSSDDRFRHLVDAVHRALPCDAAALLRFDGEVLVPVATRGLDSEVLGRRFSPADHPRLAVLCAANEPTLFPADSPLPDPFDGWVAGDRGLEGEVHACLGCPLRVEGHLVGVLTVDALEAGAFDGVDDEFLEHLAALAGAALRTADLIVTLEQNAQRQGLVTQELVRDALRLRGSVLVGSSAQMRRLREEVDLVARSDYPVLVSGPTGVGKELVVRTLHDRSARSGKPLIYLNCAALPESVAESELFGHVRGAFTGADSTRAGKFGVADGATLFLDEIGELPPALQPKLLRALQEGEVQPVGADETHRVDVRVLAATNRELESEVRAGRFRADLLHRLDVCRIRVPSLAEHTEDIAPLAGHFADQCRQRLGCGPIRFRPEVFAALEGAPWPGNVRELENVISRAVLRARGRAEAAGNEALLVLESDLGLRSPEPGGEPAKGGSIRADALGAEPRNLADAVAEYQRELVRNALEETGGNVAAAACRLALDRSNLRRLMRRLSMT